MKEKVLVFGRELSEVLRTQDIYVMGMSGFYILLSLVFFTSLIGAIPIILWNTFIICAVIMIALSAAKKDSLFIRILGVFYCIPMVPIMFSQVFNFIALVNPHDYDALLIQWDRMIFGTDPTHVLLQYSSPFLTEITQFAYMLYFFHGIILGIELYYDGRVREVHQLIRLTMFGFFVSYFLYFCLPAIGPRFTLHNYFLTNQELPGLWITEYARLFIDTGDGIPRGSLNPEAFVHRNCMPSGHTMMTLVNLLLVFRYGSRFKYLFLLFSVLLIFATVYQRYHYVVDVIAGVICCFVVMWLEPKIHRFFVKKKWVIEIE